MIGRKQKRATAAVDIGPRSLKIHDGERGLEVDLERDASGRIADASRERVREQLEEFLGGRRTNARCAISARGVTLRSLELPPVGREESERILSLQVEREFPIPLDDLAWGYTVGSLSGHAANGTSAEVGAATNGTAPNGTASNGAVSNGAVSNGAGQTGARDSIDGRATLVALRRESLDDYRSLLDECGIDATFSLGALATSSLVEAESGRWCVLDVGRLHTELLRYRDGMPASIRTLPWGGERVTEAIASALELDHDAAERAKREWSERGGPDVTESDRVIAVCVQSELSQLERWLQDAWARGDENSDPVAPNIVAVTGGGAHLAGVRERIEAMFPRAEYRTLPTSGEGGSSVTLALSRQSPGLALAATGTTEQVAPSGKWDRSLVGWAVAAVILAVLTWWTPKFIAMVRLPELEKQLAVVQDDLSLVPPIGSELAFLKRLDQLQLPAVQALHDAVAVSPGNLRVREFSLDQSGRMTFRGVVGTTEEVWAIQKGLVDRGWFLQSSVPDVGAAKKGSGQEFRIVARMSKLSDRVPIELAEKLDDGSVKEASPEKANSPVPTVNPTPAPAAPTPDSEMATVPAGPGATATADAVAEGPSEEEGGAEGGSEPATSQPQPDIIIDFDGLKGGMVLPEGASGIDPAALEALREALERNGGQR